jgi:hypothetical protein
VLDGRGKITGATDLTSPVSHVIGLDEELAAVSAATVVVAIAPKS